MRLTLFHPGKRPPIAPEPDLLAMQARKEARLAHYERFLGPSFAISARVEGAPYVDLCVFAPNPLKGRDHYTVASDGLSDLSRFSARGRDAGPAVEVFAYAPDLKDEAFAVRFMQRLAGVLGRSGQAILAGPSTDAREVDPEFPAEAKARHLVLLPPLREWKGFEGHRFSDGSEARFLWAVLLHPADLRALNGDRDAFLARLSAGPLPFLTPA